MIAEERHARDLARQGACDTGHIASEEVTDATHAIQRRCYDSTHFDHDPNKGDSHASRTRRC